MNHTVSYLSQTFVHPYETYFQSFEPFKSGQGMQAVIFETNENLE